MVFPSHRPNNFYRNGMRAPNNFFSPNQRMNFNRTPQPNVIQNMMQRFLPGNTSMANMATKGVGGISKTLTNVQQVLKVVETTAPMVKQYGPIVKNLPVMFKMMKAFKDIGVDDNDNEDNNTESPIESLDESSSESYEQPKRSSGSGESRPKLFI